MPLFAAKTASTIAEFVDVLHQVLPAGQIRWFRGHADATWKLLPSLTRTAHPDAEVALIKRFKQNAYSIMGTDAPKEEWHWLFLMQHHGAPTRLLDWSENPLVALYFAVSEAAHDAKDGDVWCLDPVGLNTAGLVQPTATGELPFFGVDVDLDKYLPDDIAHGGRPSRPPVAALAPRYFRRIAAQAGVFTVMHRERTPVEDAHAGIYAGRITIPHAAKAQLRGDLTTLGITKLALFPELVAVAEHAKEVVG
jgi:hypothetical protein